MEKGFLHYDSTLEEGYDSTSEQENEYEVKVHKRWPSSDLLPCPACDKMLRSPEEFVDHLNQSHYGIKRTKTQKEIIEKNAQRSEPGPSMEPKVLSLFTDPLELTLAPPTATPEAPPSLSLTLAPPAAPPS
ncbi:hypothetical protein U1Q18_020374 [Sarracenia purpurea var. burkii]